MSWSVLAAITKYHRLGGLSAIEIHSHSSESWGAPHGSAGRLGVWWHILPGYLDGCLLAEHSHGETGISLGPLHIKVLVLFRITQYSWSNPKIPAPNNINVGVISARILGHTNIQHGSS
jgi:hypothetical protein